MITIHLPLLGLATQNISIISEWNCTAHPGIPLTVFSSAHALLPLTPPSPYTPLRFGLLLPWNRNPPLQPFFLLSQLFVSACVIGSFGSDISLVTSC
uniref:Uncharacterized protein n=1 Tax=Knipowitschia caucasica TaxID=637954 RepID=A0AAV2MII0_KNICA